VHNREALTRACLESLRPTTVPFELCVVDNGSTDGTEAYFRRFAPPHPRTASRLTLVQLDAQAFRCPYCGSTETRLENIFGPTPCRSIRYCESCRQPFEQFKTI
jgi:glycosyltransferase involved in cell wall biosynthesis